MKKQLVFVLVIGLIGSIVWIGSLVYFTFSGKEVLTGVEQYALPIPKTFNINRVDDVFKRIEDNLLVSPDNFE